MLHSNYIAFYRVLESLHTRRDHSRQARGATSAVNDMTPWRMRRDSTSIEARTTFKDFKVAKNSF
ncbi:MAG TPA: hypothetical protein PK306_04825 [Aquabacterium sp.]|nr:hypothetical protein [Aquabacterium sp.]